MPELKQLLDAEARRLRPADAPPFAALGRRAARRRRSRAVATGVAVAATIGLAVGVLTPVLTGDDLAGPADGGLRTFAEPGAPLSFRYPAAWTAVPLVSPGPASTAHRFLTLGTTPLVAACEPVADAQVNCAQPPTRLPEGGVAMDWVEHDPAADGPGLDVVGGEETTLAGRQAWIDRGPALASCADVGGARQVDAWIRLVGRSWLSMSACLAAPAGQSEQQVLDLLASVRFG